MSGSFVRVVASAVFVCALAHRGDSGESLQPILESGPPPQAAAIGGSTELVGANPEPPVEALPVASRTRVRLEPMACAWEGEAPDRSEISVRLCDADTAVPVRLGLHASWVVEFRHAFSISAVKFYGAADGVISVTSWDGRDWVGIAGLDTIPASGFGAGWNTVEARTTARVSRLRFEWTALAAGQRRELPEVEVWGVEPPSLILDATAMLNVLAGGVLPASVDEFVGEPESITVQVTSPEAIAFVLDRDPSRFCRAFLAYEIKGWSGVASVRRSVNDGSIPEGALSGATNDWSTVVEEISPRWLRPGMNSITWSPSSNAALSSEIRNARLLGATNDGSCFVEGVSDLQAVLRSTEPILDGDVGMPWQPALDLQGSPSNVEFRFGQPVQLDSLAIHSAPGASGTLSIALGAPAAMAPLPNIDVATALEQGWDRVPVATSLAVDGMTLGSVSLSIPAGIGELVPVGSVVGSPQSARKLRVSYPDRGQFMGREAYVRGFVTPWESSSASPAIFVGTSPVASSDGSFEAIVSKDDVGLWDRPDAETWSVPVRVDCPDGTQLTKTVVFDRFAPAPESADGRLLPTRQFSVRPEAAKRMSHDSATLELEAGTVSETVEIGITPLGETDLPSLDTGMTNVTRGPRRGFRFTPHGMKFRKPLRVSLPYNPGALTADLTEEEVYSYYFDDQAGRWMALERVEIDRQNHQIISLTDHFTDMINATVTVPDHPTPLSLNPTSIKDLRAADPGEGVNLIEPPAPNNTGDARVAYPIEVPPGRTGLQPELSISYSSARGNGWMGLGWDLAERAITIDTRWGVPRYWPDKETETYMLEGEQLTPVAHRGALQDRQPPTDPDKVFHSRVEGAFRKIERHGTSPDGYWWEVTTKDGTRYFYGGDPDLNRSTPEDVLAMPAATGSGPIFKWALREIRDSNGNSIRYHNEVVSGGGTGAEPWRQIYLKSVRYTGTPGTEGPYEVSFHRQTGRTDAIVDGRPGFKTVLEDRLVTIDVKRLDASNPLIRRYRLVYADGQFGKSLLKKVIQLGDDGVTEFNAHEFEYFDDVKTNDPNVLSGFSARAPFSGATTVSGNRFVSSGQSSPFGGDRSDIDQLHFYVGVTAPCTPVKEVSAGFKTGGDTADATTGLLLLDINGDGLPDQVFDGGSGYYFRPNTSGPGRSPGFGPPQPLLGELPALGRELTSTLTAGGQGFAIGINGIADVSLSRTRGEAYWSDVNGDRLPDLVTGGAVYFNRLVGDVPTFAPESPTPLASGAASNASGMVQDPEERRAELERRFHLVDPIRKWIAPYTGTIAITGQVRLTDAPPSDYEHFDGARLSIQRNGSEIWTATLADPASGPIEILGLDQVQVAAGDKIYLRVNSINDGAYDKVQFAPTIQYLYRDLTLKDENLLPAFAFHADSDFAQGGREFAWSAPVTGVARIRGDFIKRAVTSDDVRLTIRRRTVNIVTTGGRGQVLDEVVLFSHDLASDEIATVPVDFEFPTERTGTKVHEIVARLQTDSRIDLGAVEFAPRVFYETVEGETAPTTPTGDPALNQSLPMTASVFPLNPSALPYVPWIAPRSGVITYATVASGGIPFPFGDKYDANLTLSLKRAGLLLKKRRVTIQDGEIQGPRVLSGELEVQAGDRLYFLADATESWVFDSFGVSNAQLHYVGDLPEIVYIAPLDRHTAPSRTEPFEGGYRNWWYGQYNGNDAGVAIVEDRLRLPEDRNDNRQEYFVPMIPDERWGRWRGEEPGCGIEPTVMSSSRLIVPRLDFSNGSGFGGARGVIRYGGGRNSAGNISVVVFGAGRSTGRNWSDIDFLDFNGDAYPDVVGGGDVQATLPNGALGAARYTVGGFGRVREFDSVSKNVTLGATTSRPMSDSACSLAGATSEQSPFNLSFGVTGVKGTVATVWDLIDINGDGLPDYVLAGSGGLMVRLNLGYRFAEPETWGNDGVVRRQLTLTKGANAGAGVTLPSYSFGGGYSQSTFAAASAHDLLDVNADGLVDIVTKTLSEDLDSTSTEISVRFNTGSGFLPARPYTGALPLPLSATGGGSGQVGGHFAYQIPIPGCHVVPGPYLTLNPGAYKGDSIGGATTMLTDFDGDGYLDHIHGDDHGHVQVQSNNHARTNLLMRIRRPLGAVIDLDYTRVGNTTADPESHWTLSRTAISDGVSGDGADTQLTTYKYGSGQYDRAEREFLGFDAIVEEHRDPAAGDAVYRRVVRTFLNDNVYRKGLLVTETTLDATDRKFLETIKTYDLAPVADGAGVPGLLNFTETRFPRLNRIERRFYEGQAAPGKSTTIDYSYDDLGNVTRTFDSADSGTDDDLEASFDYSDCAATHIVGVPIAIEVKNGPRALRRRESTLDCATGDVTQVREYLADGTAAVTDLTYHGDGNLKDVTGPRNHRSQRYQATFGYDAETQTHITEIRDSYGLRSRASYDLRFGRPATTTDVNNNVTSYVYDGFGRTATITGPYQQGTGLATLRFEYHPESAVPWAQTRHADPFRNAADPIDTVIFTDGVKRVLQTKKDATVHSGPATGPRDVMTVSGRLRFDAFGRTIRAHYPIVENLGSPGVFNATFDTVQPTTMEYDVLDRMRKAVIPDNTSTATAFGFGTDRDGRLQFETTVTDANGIAKRTYRDVRQLVMAVKETNRGGAETIWTSYGYDAMGQMTRIRDDRGNVTTASYDNLGRRTAIDNPDTGNVETVYDLASNPIARITPNLRLEGARIDLVYDFVRLEAIRYPDFPGNNVTYTYGAPGALENGAGRIRTVQDESGLEERGYGKLGEVVRQLRTIASDTEGNGPNSPEIYTSSWVYDTFGRLQRLTYPDGELLTYSYDSGGMVRAVRGEKGANSYAYLNRLEYDKFEQRAFVELANGVRSSYAYRPDNRRLETLASVMPSGRTFQNLRYAYDPVGNILGLQNAVAIPPASTYGGPTDMTFSYDDLYRLTSTAGRYQYMPNKSREFALAMSYDTIHNIVSKSQNDVAVQPSGTPVLQQKTSYAWWYAYGSGRPHAATHVGDRTFQFDANGNQAGWTHDRNGTRRTIVWDEENRVQSVSDNGHTETYKYDATGERVIKRGPQGETAYVNPFFTMRNREVGTKHVYVGASRLASKLLKQDRPGSPPNGNQPFEKDTYFYHADYLGSSNYVTDTDGELYEHLEYFPFGESWIEESSNTQRTPYLFTSKELDEETGLQYFGARYYDPRVGTWQSPDPVWESYLKGLPNGGYYDSRNLGLYSQSFNNPIRYRDPDGRFALVDHQNITTDVLSSLGRGAPEIEQARSGVTHVDTLGIPGESIGASFWGPLFHPGQHFDLKTGPQDSRTQFAEERAALARSLLASGDPFAAAYAAGEGMHSIQDKWAHSFPVLGQDGQPLRDSAGRPVMRQVGWWEHLARNILGGIQKLFTGKDTLSPDSPDSPGFAYKLKMAHEESMEYGEGIYHPKPPPPPPPKGQRLE